MTGADRLQQVEEPLLVSRGQHGDGFPVGGVDRVVELLDEREARRGQPAEHLPAVLRAALAAHPALGLQPVQQPGFEPRALGPCQLDGASGVPPT